MSRVEAAFEESDHRRYWVSEMLLKANDRSRSSMERLTEVLNCCLGFYTWEFGQLKLGCRINASAADAYTLANSLFQSLRLTPIQAGFEHRVLSFADAAYQYQANTAEYCDKSHAAYYGRAGSSRSARRRSSTLFGSALNSRNLISRREAKA